MPTTTVVFYQDDDRSVPVDQWLCTLPKKVQAKCQAYLGQLEDFGHELRRPIADYLRDGIYELRPSFQGVHYRMLYFFPQKKKKKRTARANETEYPYVVVVSHGLTKEGEVPDVEIDRAIARKAMFESTPETHMFKPHLTREQL